MTRFEILGRTTAVLVNHFISNGQDAPPVIAPDFQLLGGDDFDSLDFVEFQMDLEEAFDIEIPDDAAEQMTTFGDAVDYLCRALGAEAVGA